MYFSPSLYFSHQTSPLSSSPTPSFFFSFLSSPPPGLRLPPSLNGLQQLHFQQPSQSGLPTQNQVPVPGEHRPDGLGHMSVRQPLARPTPPTNRPTDRPTAQDSKPSSSSTAASHLLSEYFPSLPRELHLPMNICPTLQPQFVSHRTSKTGQKH